MPMVAQFSKQLTFRVNVLWFYRGGLGKEGKNSPNLFHGHRLAGIARLRNN